MALAVELDAELLADMLEGLDGDRVATAAMLEQQGAPDIALIRRQVPTIGYRSKDWLRYIPVAPATHWARHV